MAATKRKEVYQPLVWQSMSGLTAINPDLVLQNLNISYAEYEKMLIDPYIAKNLMIAKSFPNEFRYTIEGEYQIAVDYVRSRLEKNSANKIDLQTVYNAAVNADFYGFSVVQTLFPQRDLVGLYDFSAKHFSFSNSGDLLNVYNITEKLETYNGDNHEFVVIRNSETDNNYYGTGLAQALYYLREMRKSLAMIKQIAADKYGVTPYLATVEFTKDQQAEYNNAKAGFLSTMESIRSGGVGVVNGKNINIVPLNNTLSINDLEAADKEIGICITGLINGSTDAIESQGGGSYARAFVQNEIVRMVQGRRLAMIEKTVNTIIRWMVDYKFGTDKPAPVFSFQTANIPQFKDLIEAYNAGIPVNRDLLNPYIGEATGNMIVKQPEIPAQTAQFAETGKKKILNLKIADKT